MSHLGSYETPDRRLARLVANSNRVLDSMADDVARGIDAEARARIPLGLEGPPGLPPSITRPDFAPSPGDPTFELGGRVPGSPREAQFANLQDRFGLPAYMRALSPFFAAEREAELLRNRIPGDPSFERGAFVPEPDVPIDIPPGGFAEDVGLAQPPRNAPFVEPPTGVGPVLGGVEKLEKEAFGPIAALGLQALQTPTFAGAQPGVALAGNVARLAAEEAGVEEFVPGLKTQAEQDFVNPGLTIWGSEAEQEKAQKVFEEAGFATAMAARIVFDPLNVIPVVGFTKADDILRLVRLANKAKGAERSKHIADIAKAYSADVSAARTAPREAIGADVPAARTAAADIAGPAAADVATPGLIPTTVTRPTAAAARAPRMADFVDQAVLPDDVRLTGEEVGDVSISPSMAPRRGEKPVWEMNLDEITEARVAEEALEKGESARVFGVAGGKRYDAAQRTSNSVSASPGRVRQADKVIAEMEANLTDEQSRILFGIGETGPNAEDLRAIEQSVSFLDFSSESSLADSIAAVITRVRPGMQPSQMNTAEIAAYARLRNAFTRGPEFGLDMAEVSRLTLKKAAARFGDPEDAAFMLRDFMKQAQEPRLGPARLGGEELGDVSQAGGRVERQRQRFRDLEAASKKGLLSDRAEQELESLRTVFPEGAPETSVSQAGKLPEDIVPDVERVVSVPGGPPTGEPADITGVIESIIKRFPVGQRLLKQTNLARRAEMTKRTGKFFGRVNQLIAQGTDEAVAFDQALGSFGGEMPDVKFLESLWVSPEELAALNARRIQYVRETAHVFEGKDAMDAIMAMASKRVPRKHEMKAIRNVFGQELADTIEKASQNKDFWDNFMDVWMLPKAIRSSFDFSFPMRQGMMLAFGHPMAWSKSMKNAVHGWFKPQHVIDDFARMRADKSLYGVKQADGQILDMRLGDIVDEAGILAEEVEPFYHSGLAESLNWGPIKIGEGVRRSRISFTGAGNQLRFDTTRFWLDMWERLGVDITPERIEKLGLLLNASTGRANIPGGRLPFEVLQATWWSPQYRLSGPQVLGTFAKHGIVGPLLKTASGGRLIPSSDPFIGAVAGYNLATFVSGGIGILSLLKASGLADVEIDPRSSDFGKIQMGPTRINFWGTSQLLARTIAQSITQTRMDAELGPMEIDWRDPWARYWQSGLSPEFSLFYDVGTGETYLGDPMGPSEERGIGITDVIQREALGSNNRWMPLSWNDIWEGIEEDKLRGGLVGASGVFGVGVQSYSPTKKNQLQAIPQYVGGLTQRDIFDITRYHDRVDSARKEWRSQGNNVDDLSWEESARYLAQVDEREPNWTEWMVNLHKQSEQERLRNPEWVQFIVDNWDQLRKEGYSKVIPGEEPNYLIDAKE